MAYCVHCGVKLGEAEKKCPLCGTEAVDPTEPFDETAPRAFPVREPEQTLLVNKRYAMTLLSLLLLVPAAVCVAVDLIGGDGISWSVYPAGVLVLIWIAIASPLLLRKYRVYPPILITGATLAGYLYMIEWLSDTHGWFFPIVLPSLAVALGMICLTLWIIRNKRLRLLRLAGLLLVEVGALCGIVELLCVRAGIGAGMHWSPYVITPCVFLALLLYAISRNGPLSTELKRRFHI